MPSFASSTCSIVRASALHSALVLLTLLFTHHAQAAAPSTTSITSSGLGTIVSPTGTTTTITGGTRPSNGPNLFHSFGDFILKGGDTASFVNDSGLSTSNIIGRVTGGKVSDIYGTIKTDASFGSASLYLINPFGIVLGPTASLNVGGSMHFTTADYLRFADQTSFLGYLDGASTKSTLTTEPIAAFGFFGSTSPVDLTVGNPAPPILPRPISLEGSLLSAPSNQTISVIGGDVSLTGGRVRASNGTVLIGSVASTGVLVLGSTGLEPEGAVALGNVKIAGGHQVNVRGQGAGTVVIRGGQLILDNASIVADITIGSQEGGLIDIRTQRDMSLLNQARILTDSDIGRSGDIHLEAQTLAVKDGSRIATDAFGDAPAGDISLLVKRLELTNDGRITSSSNTDANVGNLTVEATEAILLSGSFRTRISADSTLFGGAAGSIMITTPRLQIEGGQISAETVLGSGTGGNIGLDIGSLDIWSGGVISSGTSGSAMAGNISIHATDAVTLTNFGSDIISNTSGAGDGGKISITAPLLSITDHGLIQASTFRSGNAGSIAIDVGHLEMHDGALISNDAVFTSSGPSSGRGGNVTVSATESILIANQTGDPLALTGMTSSTFGSGHAGSITVSTPILTLDNGRITADTLGTGGAGNIEVHGATITLRNGSRITSDASFDSSGRGGNVQVTADESLTLVGRSLDGRNFQSQIAASTFGTNDGGTVTLSAATLTAEDATIRALTNGPGNAGSLSITVGDLVLNSGAQVDSTTRGSGSGGPLTVYAANSVSIAGMDQAGFPSGLFSGTERDGRAGPLTVTTPNLIMADGGVISTKSIGTGTGGTMTIAADNLLMAGADTKLTAETTFVGDGIADLSVTLNILHTFDSDLVAELTSPAGSRVLLFSEVGGSGAHFSNTRLDDQAALSITEGTAPFTGVFRPQEPLVSFIGEGANGVWRLSLTDLFTLDTGTLTNWSLSLGKMVFSAVDLPKTIPDRTTITSNLTVNAGTDARVTIPTGGDGGDIIIQSHTVTLRDHANIAANTKGSGQGGDIIIVSDQASFSEDARITSDSTLARSDAGRAGTVSITTGATLALSAASVTTEAAEAAGGDIVLRAESLHLSDTALVSTRSTGSGNSGDIMIVTNDLFHSQNSRVTTEASQAFGGNIDIQTQRMIQIIDSGITTSVQSGAGNGGNITIDPQFLIVDNSQILAQAVAGNGGNISIVAGTMMVSPGSLISASSQAGISGQVSIQAPVNNIATSLSRLSQTPLNAAELLTARCSARLREGRTSSLTLAGRDGVPAEPGGWRPTAFVTAAYRPTGTPALAARSASPGLSPLVPRPSQPELHTMSAALPLPTGCGS